jgi:hypothetical protein
MKAILTLILAIAFVLSPALSEPFSGFRPDQLPIPQVDPPVQPAGYAFAIWGLIYLWLIASAVFGVMKRRDDADWDRARPALMVSLAVGATWIPIALNSAIGALVLIWVMLISALVALYRAPTQDRLWFQTPVALYAGWLTAASWVSVASVGAGYGVIFNQFAWALVAIFCALSLALLVMYRIKRAPEYALTVIWALVGIIVANQLDVVPVTAIAAVGIVILGLKAVHNIRET